MATSDISKHSKVIVSKPWQAGLGPYYVGLFLWVVFFDQLGLRALPVGGVLWPFLGALIAGPLCYLFLYRVPAVWGFRTGKPIGEIAQSTFGQTGARGGLLVLGLAEIVWFAVAIYYGTDLSLRGLLEAKLIDGRLLQPWKLGAITIKGPIFVATALFWSVAAALTGRWLVRLIAAIMYIYPVFPAMVFGSAMLAMLGGVRGFAPTGIDPLGLVSIPESRAGIWSMMLVVQLIFGFFAMAGACSADWGAATTTEADVRKGGWVVVGFAPVVIASIAFVTIAGYIGKVNPAMPVDAPVRREVRPRTPPPSAISEVKTVGRVPEATFRGVMIDGIGGRIGCGMLMIVGVAALAPAVYSSFSFGHRLHGVIPAISRTRSTLIMIPLAWPLIFTGVVDRLEVVFGLMGAVFAPLVACLAADFRRTRGVWPGARVGVNLPGLLGWASGLAIGLLPFVSKRLASFQPAAFWAFLAAFAVYTIAATLLGESQVLATVAESSPTPEPVEPIVEAATEPEPQAEPS